MIIDAMKSYWSRNTFSYLRVSLNGVKSSRFVKRYSNSTKDQHLRHSSSDIKPIVASTVLIFSFSVTIGSIFLISKDSTNYVMHGDNKGLTYPNQPPARLSQQFESSDNSGAAVTVEAFSIGEEITPGALMLRYAFHESDFDDALELQQNINANIEDVRGRDETTFPESTIDSKKLLFGRELKEWIDNRSSQRKKMQVIGKGAYGHVIGAVDRQTRQKVAMKVVAHSAMTAEGKRFFFFLFLLISGKLFLKK